jgi:hypothetical protein
VFIPSETGVAMAPQPLSRVSPRPDIRIGPNAFKQAPGAADAILEVLTTWSTIETRIAAIISTMLKTDYEAASAMYRSLTGGQAKRAALDAIAAHTLPGPSYCLLQAVLKVTKPSRDRRNDFAHHIWGHDKTLPGALILVPPDVLSELDIEARKYHERGLQPKIVLTKGHQINIANSAPLLDYDRIAVWRLKDLWKEAASARTADDYFAHLRIGLSDSPVREQRRKLLFDVPEIDRAFEALSHTNDQSSHLRHHRQRRPRPD